VQIMMIGFRDSEVPDEVRSEVHELGANPAVRLLDVQVFNKERGQLSRLDIDGLTSVHESQSQDYVDRIFTKAMSAQVMSGSMPTGEGYLMRPDPLPDPQTNVPENTHVLVLLLEHIWAKGLWNSARENGAVPLADAWIGRQPLADAGLDSGAS
jgi:hypothetical protein